MNNIMLWNTVGVYNLMNMVMMFVYTNHVMLSLVILVYLTYYLL